MVAPTHRQIKRPIIKIQVMKYKLIKQIASKENRQSLKEAIIDGMVLLVTFISLCALSLHLFSFLWVF